MSTILADLEPDPIYQYTRAVISKSRLVHEFSLNVCCKLVTYHIAQRYVNFTCICLYFLLFYLNELNAYN